MALRISFCIAAAIVSLGSLAGAVLTIVFLQRRYRKQVAAQAGAPLDHELALLMYAASCCLWIAGLAFTITVKQPRTARTCGILTVVHLTGIAIATCATIAVLAAYADRWM